MGGISANKPIVHLVTGPMMPGSHKGERIGACTDCRNNWAKFRAGAIDVEDISAINEELAPTVSNLHHFSCILLTCRRLELAASWGQRAQWPASWQPLA
jgi:hypothetical protein